jgi:hypothetical protein
MKSVGARAVRLTALTVTVITIALINRKITGTAVFVERYVHPDRPAPEVSVPARLVRSPAMAVVLIPRKIIGTAVAVAVAAEMYVHLDRPVPTENVAAPLGRRYAPAVVLIIRQILGTVVAAEMHVNPARGGIALKVIVAAPLGRLCAMAFVSLSQ